MYTDTVDSKLYLYIIDPDLSLPVDVYNRKSDLQPCFHKSLRYWSPVRDVGHRQQSVSSVITRFGVRQVGVFRFDEILQNAVIIPTYIETRIETYNDLSF